MAESIKHNQTQEHEETTSTESTAAGAVTNDVRDESGKRLGIIGVSIATERTTLWGWKGTTPNPSIQRMSKPKYQTKIKPKVEPSQAKPCATAQESKKEEKKAAPRWETPPTARHRLRNPSRSRLGIRGPPCLLQSPVGVMGEMERHDCVDFTRADCGYLGFDVRHMMWDYGYIPTAFPWI